MLMAGKRGSKPESLQGSPLHAVSPDNKPATLKTAKSCKTNTSCKFVVTLPTPSFHEEDISVSFQTDDAFSGNLYFQDLLRESTPRMKSSKTVFDYGTDKHLSDSISRASL